MKYLLSFLCVFWAFDQAFSEDCPTRKPNGEACIVTQQPSTDVDGNWVTHKLPVSNDCDCQCHADFTTIEGDRLGADVLPHGKDSVICTNVNGKGCTGYRKDFTFHCMRFSSNEDDQRNRSRSGTQDDQHRNFSKDQCRDERCASADYSLTENWKLTNATKAICDQQYLQCLKDGQAKPDFDQALRVARTQVPAEERPTPPPPERQLVGNKYGQMVECFNDSDFNALKNQPDALHYRSNGPVLMCLSPRYVPSGNGCMGEDIVNGQLAYICAGDYGAPQYALRKQNYDIRSPSEPKLVTDDGWPLVECRRGGWIICLAKDPEVTQIRKTIKGTSVVVYGRAYYNSVAVDTSFRPWSP
jgi:hypothetical protein